MSKITLSQVADLTQVSTAQTTINSNSTTVQTAFDNTLSRDGTQPNTMGANLDMNSNQILNLPAPNTSQSPLRLADLPAGAVNPAYSGGTNINVSGTVISAFTGNTNVIGTLDPVTIITGGGGVSVAITGGPDLNPFFNFTTRGTGSFAFLSGGGAFSSLNISGTTIGGGAGVNSLTVYPSQTGASPAIQASGSDTNVGMLFSTKGTGGYVFLGGLPGFGGPNIFLINGSTTAVNFLTVNAGATGAPGSIFAGGGDTNVNMTLSTKGAGNFTVQSNTFSNTLFQVTGSTTSVNFLSVSSANTGLGPVMGAVGSDTNIGLALSTKGNGGYSFLGNGVSQTLFQIIGSTTSVNFVQINPANTGGPPIVSSNGSDTNIDLAIQSKGTGIVQFATASNFTANGAVATTMTSLGPTGSHTTIQEWLTIKDNAGTVRYIPCY